MENPQPDFSIVERTSEGRLRDRGLTPSRVGTGIATGHQRLELYRQETQVAEFDLDQPPGHGFIGSVEVKIVLEPPSLGEFEVRDRVTQRGLSLEGALETCANTFMDVTFPPLEALFTGKRPEGPGTGTLTLTSFTIGLDRAIKWDVVLGQLQILNDTNGEVRAKLKSQPPVTLMLDTLTRHLAEPRLHWCKLYGANTPAKGLVFGCSIDGQKSPQAEAEMSRKFGEPLSGEWEFRQFLAVRPMGDADPQVTAELRARAAAAFPEKKTNWWSRLFGGAT
ncbi:MAG: DUF6348 family protein [Tepidisphaeraceae bacterium]